MLSTHPKFNVEVLRLVEPIGQYTHVVCACPRCKRNMGINGGMVAGLESIKCMGKFEDGRECRGHYYLRGSQLEFVGTF